MKWCPGSQTMPLQEISFSEHQKVPLQIGTTAQASFLLRHRERQKLLNSRADSAAQRSFFVTISWQWAHRNPRRNSNVALKLLFNFRKSFASSSRNFSAKGFFSKQKFPQTLCFQVC